MSDLAILNWLTEAIGQLTRSAKFCVSGVLPPIDPGLHVDGLGPVALPLRRGQARHLIARCQVAPFGKGTETLVDTSVRKTFELAPEKFRLSRAWNDAIEAASRTIATELGLPADRLEVHPDKLLVYERGGFFLPHRDSEKLDHMVASLIVVLPNVFEGGALTVRHGDTRRTIDFQDAARGEAAAYAAFYADCEHEVGRVSRGVRICLTYNLALRPAAQPLSQSARTDTRIDRLAESIATHFVIQPATPLVFVLEHQYTERGLTLDLLKGEDRRLAACVVDAAAQVDCLVHLAQVTRHLLQFADDGSFGYGRSWRWEEPTRRRLEIGETYSDEIQATHWVDLTGQAQPFGTIPLDLSAVLSRVPIDDWKPDEQHFEGYTGNEGNTLDRMYRRAALILWSRTHHFEVLVRSGVEECLPLFGSMVSKLAKTPKAQRDAARLDCTRFARALIGRWPNRRGANWAERPGAKSPHDDFGPRLLVLKDRETIALFLKMLAERDDGLSLDTFVLKACREFGSSALADELKGLLAAKATGQGAKGLALRDARWLATLCLDENADPAQARLGAALCRLAADRFCEPLDERERLRNRWRYGPDASSLSEQVLAFLVKALVAIRADDDLARVLDHVEQAATDFGMDLCQVPCLVDLIPWARQRPGGAPARLESWLDSVRRRLTTATARRPSPPSDRTRSATLRCSCSYCRTLNAFLADPNAKEVRIPANEANRSHLLGEADRHQCDVSDQLLRKGSPYSLIFTKTQASYDRAVRRFEADCILLQRLPSAP